MTRGSRNYLKMIIVRVVLGCFGMVMALALIELGLRFIPSERLDSIIERSSQRLQLYRLDPRIGWSLQPHAESVITTQEGLAIPIKINSLGLRDQEHSYEKPANHFRVLILGDSFAEAQDVYLEESFPYRVEQCLNQKLVQPTEVINGGVSGYNTADEYLFYLHEGVKYKPDLVLLVIYIGNDFSGLDRTTEERLVAGFGGYRFSFDKGRLRQTWISWESPHDNQTSTVELLLRRYSRFYRFLAHPESKIYWAYRNNLAELQQWLQAEAEEKQSIELQWSLYKHVNNFPDNPIVPLKMKQIWAVFQILIEQLNAKVQENGSQLAVIVIPVDYQTNQEVLEHAVKEYPILYNEDFNAEWRIDEPNSTIIRQMNRQSIPVLDLLSHFQAHHQAGGYSLYFEGIDEHLNRDGHKLMADVMCDWLIRNQSIHLPRH